MGSSTGNGEGESMSGFELEQMKHSASLHTFTAEEIAALRCDLLAWFDVNKREMPWRKTVDYAVSFRSYRTNT